MTIHIDSYLKEHIIEQRLRYGRTLKSLKDEYGYSKIAIGRWCKEYQQDAASNAEKAVALSVM